MESKEPFFFRGSFKLTVGQSQKGPKNVSGNDWLVQM